MGKKSQRTRWRTLTIADDEHSDSEESNTTTSGHHRESKGYPQKSYYSRFLYSSQSTPTRRYQYDGPKSTRSSSTASENKITFNEDEYTRITTPRQDVLFKKGYLNKPRTYQSQTSTGNSTTSTGNSTGNGTPDHQSTDLDYESQFVFPNGFVDQNGIYYVNSFEPYPLMVFNPPTYYQELSNAKTKRYSTGSLTESTSPHNEETSQELSQSETPSNVSDMNAAYNVVYPGFYFDGACQSQDPSDQSDSRRVKKRRRRKLSRSKSASGTTSDYTDDESSDEVFSDDVRSALKLSSDARQENQNEDNSKSDPQTILLQSLMSKEDAEAQSKLEPTNETREDEQISLQQDENEDSNCPKSKYDLKPDAEEFIPMAYRQPEVIPMMDPNLQYIKLPPNFVPVPILGDFNGQNFNAFIPPGIPINFIPHQNFVNFVPSFNPNDTNQEEEEFENDFSEEQNEVQTITQKHEEVGVVKKIEPVPVPTINNNNNSNKVSHNNNNNNNKDQIDIAKIVSKLEEQADKEITTSPARNFRRNRYQNNNRPSSNYNPNLNNSPKKNFNSRNYSETLMKNKPQSFNNQHHDKKELTCNSRVEVKINRSPVKKVEENVTKSSAGNQWISVSSRKKRKNRNVEEDFDEFEAEDKDKDLFEIYDVKLLQDVIPDDKKLVSETHEVEDKQEVKPSTSTEAVKAINEDLNSNKVTPKRKSKNKNNKHHTTKSVTRRVIIKDMDLSLEAEETVNDVSVNDNKPEVEEVKVEVKNEVVEEEGIKQDNTVTKKANKNKKKKNKVRTNLVTSESSSDATINVVDDSSYDFLLENSLLDESVEKTNLEVSQELDKMIQRGMYSNLEEKIKSMNMETNDTFFKSIINNISSRESSVDKNSFSSTSDFGKILENTAQLLKPKAVILEPVKAKLDNACCPHTRSNFLGDDFPPAGAGIFEDGNKGGLYPITNAVKDWMSKTREKTPEVEILKSPSAIFREFCDESVASEHSREDSEDDNEVYESNCDKIQQEIEEKKVSGNLNFPTPGNLPYRAICCSIM